MITPADAAEVIANYRHAWEAVNAGPAPQIAYERGWFRFRGQPQIPKYRRATMLEMTERLRARAAK